MNQVSTIHLHISLVFLSLMAKSLQQSDSCSYQGQQVNGEFTIPGFCLLYRCIPGQGVTAIGCGIRIPPSGCYIEHPETKNYPECCYTRVVCPEANSINSRQKLQRFDQFNGTFINQNLGYPKVSYGPTSSALSSSSRGSFAKKQGFATDSPQVLKTLTPPFPGSAPVFRPSPAQKKKSSTFGYSGYSNYQNIHNSEWEDNLNSAPYYYKK